MSKEFIASVIKQSAEVTGAASYRIADDLIEALKKTLKKDGKFTLPGFGTFRVCKTKARKGLNPRTGESVQVKAGTTVRFKASPVLKSEVGGRSARSALIAAQRRALIAFQINPGKPERRDADSSARV